MAKPRTYHATRVYGRNARISQGVCLCGPCTLSSNHCWRADRWVVSNAFIAMGIYTWDMYDNLSCCPGQRVGKRGISDARETTQARELKCIGQAVNRLVCRPARGVFEFLKCCTMRRVTLFCPNANVSPILKEQRRISAYNCPYTIMTVAMSHFSGFF